jgi:hypothetical protein
MKSKSGRDRLPKGKTFWQVAIDAKLHRNFKSRCAAKGKTMSAQVEELIRAWLR